MNTKLILNQLIKNKSYVSKTLPFIIKDYFEDPLEKAVFSYIQNFITEYNTLPSDDVIEYYASQDNDLRDDELQEMSSLWKEVMEINTDDMTVDWLVDITEEWCKDRAIYLAITQSISIITDEKKKSSKKLINNAL